MRGSRFKHYLLDSNQLGLEAESLGTHWTAMPPVELWRVAELCFFLLAYFQSRARFRGIKRWAASPKAQQRAGSLIGQHDYQDAWRWFKEERLLKVPGAIHETMVRWQEESWPLTITARHYTPIELMDLQSIGKRVVTVDLNAAMSGRLIEGERDAFEFVLHDLMHAFHFFRDQDNCLAQTDFYQFLAEQYRSGLREKMESDPELRHNLEYVMSDMNSHIDHLKATYRAHMSLHEERVQTGSLLRT